MRGSGTKSRYLKSIDTRTGLLADSLKIGHGAIIAAGNMLYYYNQQGVMNLIGTDQGKMKVVSSFKVNMGTRQHFSHPVIDRGILYQRHGHVLMAFDIREQDPR